VLFGEVPALPVVVPVAVVAFGLLIWRLHRRGEMSLLRVLVAAALCVYGAGVVANTVFPIFLDMPGGARPWSSSISMRWFDDYEVADAVQNVVVFVPLGVLVPLVARVRSPWPVAVVGVLLSLLIETIQFFSAHYLHGGHVADVNDLFFNALGAPLGYGLLVVATRAPVLGDLVRRTSGSPTPR
jgi:glycopeptide antibiotics resistance protein